MRVSGPVEGFGVGEQAAEPGLICAQDADLEVRLPLRPGRGDLVDGAELEPEPAVVRRVAEQRDQRLAEGATGFRPALMAWFSRRRPDTDRGRVHVQVRQAIEAERAEVHAPPEADRPARK